MMYSSSDSNYSNDAAGGDVHTADIETLKQTGRWLSGTEALVAQAFPVHHTLHKNFRVCPFNVALPHDGCRSSRVMRQQAGNSMNLFAITVQFLYLMLYVEVLFLVGPYSLSILTVVVCEL